MLERYNRTGIRLGLCVSLASLLLAAPQSSYADSNSPPRASAQFINANGQYIGMAMLEETASGVIIRIEAQGLTSGDHAIHLHEKGSCSPVLGVGMERSTSVTPFKDAGPHVNNDATLHGKLNPGGPHTGDFDNVHVAADGTLHAQLFSDDMTLRSSGGESIAHILDRDGTAIVIHEGPDDYRTPPAGASGSPVACAVIKGS